MSQKYARYSSRQESIVMPAQAGIQGWCGVERPIMDSRFRGNDKSESQEFFAESFGTGQILYEKKRHDVVANQRDDWYMNR